VPYAYQTKMSRTAIRGHPILKDLHEFLINETELVCFLTHKHNKFLTLIRVI